MGRWVVMFSSIVLAACLAPDGSASSPSIFKSDGKADGPNKPIILPLLASRGATDVPDAESYKSVQELVGNEDSNRNASTTDLCLKEQMKLKRNAIEPPILSGWDKVTRLNLTYEGQNGDKESARVLLCKNESNGAIHFEAEFGNKYNNANISIKPIL